MRLSNLGDDIIMITCCIIECEIAACQIMLKLNVNSIEWQLQGWLTLGAP